MEHSLKPFLPTLGGHSRPAVLKLCHCCSVAKSCLTLCGLMDCSTPGSSVLQYFPEFAQIMSIEAMMLSNHFILCHPLLLSASIFLSIRVLSRESDLCIRWPKYWSFSISPSSEYSGLTSFRTDQFAFLADQGTPKSFSNTTIQKHQFSSNFGMPPDREDLDFQYVPKW